MLRHVGVGARDEDAELRHLRARRPDLLAVDDELVAVTHRPGGERGEVAARAGLAEQLAPDLFAGEQREAGSGPSARRCRRRGSSGLPTRSRSGSVGATPSPCRISSSITSWRIGLGVEPPRTRPVRHDVPGLGELPSCRLRIGCEPLPHLESLRGVVFRQIEVHVATVTGRRSAAPVCPQHRLWIEATGADGSLRTAATKTRSVPGSGAVPS